MTVCSLRAARGGDAALLSDLALRSKGMWPAYTPEFLEACRDELTYTADDIASFEQHFVVACREEKVLGFYALRVSSPQTIELEALFIEPDVTRQGIGQQLMREAVVHATALGAHELTILSDPHAEPFYASMGAIKFDQRESGSVAGRFLPLMRVPLTPWRVRFATLADAGLLADLAERLFIDAFAKDNTQDDLDAYVALSFGEDIQACQILDPDNDSLLIEDEGAVVGYAQLNYGPAPAALKLARPAGISRFYLDARVHGRGAAKVLFDAVQAKAGQRSAEHLWLGVWERNARAIAYYKKAGFDVRGDTRFLLGQDLQRDLLMARSVSK